jgi:two-component system chemotaxis response regulator CheY
MTDELVSLKAMIVSGVAGDRDLIRRAMAGASIPVIVTEIEAAGDATAALKALAGDTHEAVLFDSAMPGQAMQALVAAIRGEPGRPLAVAIGDASGLDVDCVLAKPVEQQQAASLIENCIAVRLPKRVLVVDDSAAVRSVIQKVLKASRFRITADEADGHASAVEQVRRGAFDVVILDCHMSGEDGFETLAELRKIRPDARILMITEKQDRAMAERARGEGAADLLYKPFFANDIDTAFNRLFRLAHLRWS